MSGVHRSQRRALGLVSVTGADARDFLHAQTTQAIRDLPESRTRLAAWLSAKGRVRALFDIVPSDDGFWLVTDADNVDWLVQQLRPYVLRSAVRIEAPSDWAVFSVFGDVSQWLGSQGIALDDGTVVARGNAIWLNATTSSITVLDRLDALQTDLADLPDMESETADLIEISLGRPAVPAILRERYTPHMLNLDRLGAVSFTKGCYPGQEIVARTENLGTAKRRLKRFEVESGARPRAGDPLLDAEDNSVGEVNRVAATSAGFQMLAVVPVAPDEVQLRLESDGRRLNVLPLPGDA
jgi:tRNA-modifying protein YgfZ